VVSCSVAAQGHIIHSSVNRKSLEPIDPVTKLSRGFIVTTRGNVCVELCH
jgi:hypothetical protein